ncbi:MAG: alpha/beta hydrolase, partial [Desulfatibacillaceae bacterium]|nr:alpha/beta hydrolase [Desulfatibacillaceae bacterium]
AFFSKTSLILAALALIALCGCTSIQGRPGDITPAQGGINRFVEVNGTRFHYIELEGEKEVVFLQHGFASSSFSFEEVARILNSQGYHVYALDMKGFGWSDKPRDGAYDPASLMEGINSVMEALSLEQVNFAGNSLGGGMGFLLAEKYPHRVKRLILIDSTVPYKFKKPLPVRLANLPLAPQISPIMRSRWFVKKNLKETLFNPEKATPERVEAYYQRLKTPNAMFAQALVARGAHMDIYGPAVAAIAKSGLPCHLIWGRQDEWIPLEFGKRLKADIPQASMDIIEQCGHIPQEEKPRETAESIINFIEGQSE